MKGMTPATVTKVCGGKFVGDPAVLDREISFVTRDSREAGEGCLFAAIPGERVDGHDYLESCRQSGALCAICQRDPGYTELPYILVDNTQTALGALSAWYRRRFDIPVIGVTGSVGKTSAKEMMASVLSQRFNTLKTQGNYNNELGVPLTLLSLRQEHEAAVVEMGISDFGEMERLTAMVRPTAAVITTVGFSHLEKLGDLDGVLKAKTAVTEGMDKNSLLLINGDDQKLRGYAAPIKTLSYGLEPHNDIRAENVRALGLDGMELDIRFGERRLHARIRAFGDHLVYAALAGAAAGFMLGLTDEEISQGINGYESVGRRSRAVDTGRCVVIDDCYNSNPNSLASALRSLALLPGRKVCVLGDMLELGKDSPALHRRVGELAAKTVQLVITHGEMAKYMYESAAATGNALHFDEKQALLDALPGLIAPGDCVLVKASRGMRFEDVSEKLMSL
ncbi:MAG: UDP-N-acetylmuramoyl-tripeptide--D-alanyl-D-alanine ligase [Candidatus Heteroscillospira sp.]|jgi:UDP-N-acetylmuramoyl-tripeptide--D-alanyl-D-alanine ligase